MKGEAFELICDIKEHLLFLQELGVGSLEVELPEWQVSERPAKEKEILQERYIPEVPLVVAKPLPSPSPLASASRKSLLEGSRLSGLPSLSKRIAPSSLPASKIEGNFKEMLKNPEETMPDGMGNPESSPGLPESGESIEEIRADIGNCRRCELCEGRTNIAHSNGSFSADLMFIGEAPGADEDIQAAPFVGRAGQLLTKIIEAIGIKREDCFIGNINRCRPPQNRAPLPNEVAACKPFLLREIAVVKPKVIVVMGNTACKNLLDTTTGISKIRGIFQDYYGIKVMPTFHPAYLLRDPHKKREVWEDMKKVRDYLAANSQ